MYGNYGLWSWLRYWYLDTENIVTYMLVDKGVYDYDYSEPKRKMTAKEREKAEEIWSDERIQGILGRAVDPSTGRKVFASATKAEELQRQAMNDRTVESVDN